jgi:hypothetical protein
MVAGEVLCRNEPGLLRVAHDFLEELARDLVLHESITILRERRRVPARVVEIHVEEEPEQQVVVEPLAELPLGSHRIQRDQKLRFQQPLGRDRWPTNRRVHRVERRVEPRQRPVRQQLDLSNRMRRRDPASLATSSSKARPENPALRACPEQITHQIRCRSPGAAFSAAC